MANTEIRSGLAFVDVESENPLELFRIWHQEAKNSGLMCPDALCLATSTRDGQVTARHLLLRRLEPDGFVIMTDKRSRKCKQIEDNPNASMVFLWCYERGVDKINRQVRIEGVLQELPRSDFEDLYENEPVYCKIRSHICNQGQPVDWKDMKSKHDRLYNEVVNNGADLPMPDHFIALKLQPRMIEFYYASDYKIGDRVMFSLQDNTEEIHKKWAWKRIAA